MATKKKSAPSAAPTPDDKPILLGDDTELIAWMPADRDIIVLARSTFRGKTSLDIRRYYDAGDGWRPSPKGLRFPEVKTETNALLIEAFKAELS